MIYLKLDLFNSNKYPYKIYDFLEKNSMISVKVCYCSTNVHSCGGQSSCKIIAFDGQKNVDVVCIRVIVVKEVY